MLISKKPFQFSINIFFNPPFREITKKREAKYDFKQEINILQFIHMLEKQYDSKFKKLIWDEREEDGFHDRLIIILNGISYRDPKFLQKTLKDGDKLFFAHTFYGG